MSVVLTQILEKKGQSLEWTSHLLHQRYCCMFMLMNFFFLAACVVLIWFL